MERKIDREIVRNGNERFPVPVVLLTGVGAVLRIIAAIEGRLGFDDIQVLWIINFDKWHDMLSFLINHETHPPLFYILLKLWCYLFGGSGVASISFSIVCGTALIPTIYFAASRMYTRSSATTAALLTTFAPLHVYFSSHVRPYTILPLLTLISNYCLWKAASLRNIRYVICYSFIMLSMLLIHNWVWLILGGHLAVLSILTIVRRVRKETFLPISYWFIGSAMLAAGFAPWFPHFVHQVRHPGYGMNAESFNVLRAIAEDLLVSSLLDRGRLITLWGIVLIVATILTFFSRKNGADTVPKSNSNVHPNYFMLLASTVTIVSATVLSQFTYLRPTHCLSIMGPCFIPPICDLVGKIRLDRRGLIPKILVCAILLVYLRDDRNLIVAPLKPQDEAAAVIVRKSSAQIDLILCQPEVYATLFFYYYDGAGSILNYPGDPFRGPRDFQDLSHRLSDPLRFESFLKKISIARSDKKRIWFVTNQKILDGAAADKVHFPIAAERLDFHILQEIRSAQICKELISLYGEPRFFLAAPTKQEDRDETVDYRIVCLFEVNE